VPGSSRAALATLAAFAALAPAALRAQSVAEPPRGAAALAQAADALPMTARVLVVGAHPDDEDTRLIAYLARGGTPRRRTCRSPAATAARTSSATSSARR
jgi:hypothetical protein